MTKKAQSILDCACMAGESLVWDDRRQRLLWIDMLGQTIHSFDPETRDHQTWDTPEIVTSIGLRADGGYIVGLKKRVALWNISGCFETLAEIEPNLPENRLNEGCVGPDGHFWIGTMQNNVDDNNAPQDQTAATGLIYRVSPNGTVIPLSDDIFGLPNTLVWHEDRLIVGDTSKNIIYKYRIDPETSRLSDRQDFFDTFSRGLPDGSCSDADGKVWNCRVVGGSCIVRIAQDGVVATLIETPCSWPTSCVFGGPKLDTLYIASARFTMSPEHLIRSPWEGNLFAVKPGPTGVSSYRFGV